MLLKTSHYLIQIAPANPVICHIKHIMPEKQMLKKIT